MCLEIERKIERYVLRQASLIPLCKVCDRLAKGHRVLREHPDKLCESECAVANAAVGVPFQQNQLRHLDWGPMRDYVHLTMQVSVTCCWGWGWGCGQAGYRWGQARTRAKTAMGYFMFMTPSPSMSSSLKEATARTARML